MNRPAKIRAIYVELRNVLDESYSDREVLKFAYSVVLAYTAAEKIDDDYYGVTKPERALFTLPIDEAMNDGGWRILDFEGRRGIAFEDGARTEFEDDVAPEIITLVSRLNKIRRTS